MKKLFLTFSAFLILVLPSFLLAATPDFSADLKTSSGAVSGFLGSLVVLVNAGIKIVLAAAVVVFIFAVIRYILAPGAPQKANAKAILVFGVAAITVSLSILGLAQFLIGFFGINTGSGLIGASKGTGPLNDLVNALLTVINAIIPLLFAFGILVFIAGIIRFLWRADNVTVRQNGRELMVWGVISVAVILGMWSLVFTVKTTFFPSAATPLSDPSGGDGGSTDGVYLLRYITSDGEEHSDYIITLDQCKDQLADVKANEPGVKITVSCAAQ